MPVIWHDDIGDDFHADLLRRLLDYFFKAFVFFVGAENPQTHNRAVDNMIRMIRDVYSCDSGHT